MVNLNSTSSVKSLAAGFIISLSSMYLYGQTEIKPVNSVGIIMETYASGNAHGAMYSGLVNFNLAKSSISIGPCIQKRNMNFTDGKIVYAYLLNAPRIIKCEELDAEEFEERTGDVIVEDGIQIKFNTYVQYLQNASLAFSAEKLESHVNRIENINWKSVQLSTVECGIGFEFNVRLRNNLYIRNYINASVYYHTKYIQNMHHEQYATTLNLGTSISIPSFKLFSMS